MRALFCHLGRLLRILALALLATALFSLISCAEDRESPYEGIEITPSVSVTHTYSEGTLEYAEELIYGVLYSYESECGKVKVSAAKVERLHGRAAEIAELSADGKISEESYLALLRAVYAEREVLAGLFYGESELSSLEELYLTATDLSGREYFCGVLFELMLYHYEKERDEALSAYAASGAGYQLALANKNQKNIDTLKESVGRENISRVLDLLFLIAELSCGDAFLAGGASLSDGEVLMLLTYRSPEELTVGTDGWSLILTELSSTVLIKESPSFLEKMYFAAAKNGDVAELSERMPRAISLLSKIQSRLDTADAAYLKSGDGAALASSVLGKFDEADFSELDYVLSISYENLEYSSLATEYYGAEFTEYFGNLTTADISALRASVGTDTFIQTLKGYIAGKCPALAYAIFVEK